jgi:hypothetical protein
MRHSPVGEPLNRPLRLAVLAAVIVVAGGWIAYSNLWSRGGAKPLPYRDLTATLAPLEPTEETQGVFRRRDQLARYVRTARPGEPLRLPRIDFSHDEAVFFASGPRSSTGYALRLVSAREERGRAVFTFREQTPALGERQQVRVTYPYRLLVFRKLDKPVYFELQGRP